MLPSEVGRLPLIVELDFAGTWVDVSTDVLDQQLAISRGAADEGSQPDATSVGLLLDNRDGNYTPHLATGDHYPNVKRGVRCRLRRPDGPAAYSYLSCPGTPLSGASTPHHSSFNVTDLDIRAWVDRPYWGWRKYVTFTDRFVTLAAKWNPTGDQRSWRLMHFANEPWVIGGDTSAIVLWWSTDGTISGGASAFTDQIPFPIGRGPKAVRATLDVNNGAGGWTANFYTGPSLVGPWTLVSTMSDTGVTSIFNSTAALTVGRGDSANFQDATDLDYALNGKLFGAELLSSIGGSVVASPDFTDLADGATGVTDPQGRTWTVTGDANVTQIVPSRLNGSVDSWRPTWPYGDLSDPDSPADNPGESRCSITVSGELRRLSQGRKALSSALFRAFSREPLVRAYWPWEDGTNATSAASPILGVAPATYGPDPSAISFAAESTLPGSGPLPTIQGGQGFGWSARVPSASGDQWRCDLWLKIPTASAGFTTYFTVKTTGTVATWEIAADATNVRLQGLDATGTVLISQTDTATDFYGDWIRVVLYWDVVGGTVDGYVTWYMPGVIDDTGHSGLIIGSTSGSVGRATTVGALFTAPSGGVSFGHVAVTSGVKNTTDDFVVEWVGDGAGWLLGADTGFTGELAGDRILRLCNEEGVTVEVLGDIPGETAMGPQRSLKLLELLQECADADMGVMVDDRDRKGLIYRNRYSQYNQTPALVLDAAVSEIAAPFEPVEDDQRLRNDITVSRVDGSSYRAVSPELEADPENEPVYDDEATINVATDEQLPDQAGWRLHLGTFPGMRYPKVASELTIAPDRIADWEQVDVGDRVQVINLPPQHPADTVDLIVEGYTDNYAPTRWTPELTCGPAGPWTVGVVEDDELGRADTEGSELHASATSVATSLDVAVTEGVLWTTAGAQFPFRVTVGGEEVEATDIDASLVTFGATGTASHANNANVTPGLPASTVAGNLLLCLAGIRNSGTGVPNTPTGFTRLQVFNPADNVQLFARVADGTATDTPTVSFTGGAANATCSAQMIRLGGNWHHPDNVVAAAISQLNASGQDIAYPALKVPEANCIVLYLGWKQDDWTSVATIGGATEIGEPSSTLGDDQGLVWDYVIQTTATAIAAGSFTVTGGVAAISRGAVAAIRCDRQTWTVVRSKNGVVKDHDAGTPLALTHPWVAAL